MAFRIKLKKSVGESVKDVKSAVAENGGTFEWDGESGQLSVPLPPPFGTIQGNCKVIAGQEMEVNITKKPLVVTEKMIKKKIEEYLC